MKEEEALDYILKNGKQDRNQKQVQEFVAGELGSGDAARLTRIYDAFNSLTGYYLTRVLLDVLGRSGLAQRVLDNINNDKDHNNRIAQAMISYIANDVTTAQETDGSYVINNARKWMNFNQRVNGYYSNNAIHALWYDAKCYVPKSQDYSVLFDMLGDTLVRRQFVQTGSSIYVPKLIIR